MASLFAGLAGLAKATTASISGEEARFLPMKRPSGPNAAALPDPSRPTVDVVATFAEEADLAFDGQARTSFNPTPSAGSIVTASFEASGLEIRAGLDRLERRDTGDVFVIAERRPDGLGGVTCRLTVVKV